MRILIVIMLLSFQWAGAQTTVSGKITDKNKDPLPGANVLIKDSYDGASTLPDGSFSFITEEKGEREIVVTFVGYEPVNKVVTLNGSSLQLEFILKETINELDAVIITAGSFTAGEEKRRTILNALDIASTAGATADIAGALNTLPGTQKVGESGRLFVRGGDGTETRTFIDGMVVMDAYQSTAPNTPSRGRFMPFMFKGTSFSTGGYSAEYGQALSSALVLNSKDKAELNQTDLGILSVGADVAHTQVWENSSLSGKIQYTNLTPYLNLVRQEIDWKQAPVSIEGSTAYRHQWGKDGIVKFFGNFNQSSFSLSQSAIDNPENKSKYSLKNTYAYGNASLKKLLSKQWMLRGGVSYTFNNNEAFADTYPIGQSEKGVHAKAVADYSINDKIEMHFGTETFFRNYQGYHFNLRDSQPIQFNETLSSAFAETEIYLSEKLVTKAGLRSEYNSLTHSHNVDPRLSLAYKPGNQGQFSFAYGRFVQSPRNEYLATNTALNSESAEHAILNYQVIKNDRTFRVEAYYKSYSRLVKFEEGMLTNNGYGYAKGIEVFWRDNKSLPFVDYWISYSYLDTKRDYLNFPVKATPSFASKHNFSIVYKHFIQSIKSQIGATYSFASGRPYHNPNILEFNSERTPSYQDLSVNLTYLVTTSVLIHASCTNLLGHDNVFGYEYASRPTQSGIYASRPIKQPAPRFLFIGVFFTFSKNKTINQLPNL